MKLRTLIEAASCGYPDNLVILYHENPDGEHGDGLANFIASELQATFDSDASFDESKCEAMRAMETARRELEQVIRSLGRMLERSGEMLDG